MAFAGTWLLFLPILMSPRGLGLIPLSDAVGFFKFLLPTYAGPYLAGVTAAPLSILSGNRSRESVY